MGTQEYNDKLLWDYLNTLDYEDEVEIPRCQQCCYTINEVYIPYNKTDRKELFSKKFVYVYDKDEEKKLHICKNCWDEMYEHDKSEGYIY